jgi:hypothetical protein
MEQLVEWELSGETNILRENIPQCHFVHHKSHMTWHGTEYRLMWQEDGTSTPELQHSHNSACKRGPVQINYIHNMCKRPKKISPHPDGDKRISTEIHHCQLPTTKAIHIHSSYKWYSYFHFWKKTYAYEASVLPVSHAFNFWTKWVSLTKFSMNLCQWRPSQPQTFLISYNQE